MTTLFIAEKPSVARDLARVLGDGSARRKDGALTTDSQAFGWCYGHLCELAHPEAYKEGWKSWSLAALPMIPEGLQFETRARSADARKQLKVLQKLCKGATEIVNACDAGREGELIFWWVMRMIGWGKGLPIGEPGQGTVSRMWLTSMTDQAIAEGFASRQPIGEYSQLAAAATARAEADWLLGLNLTRAASLVLSRKKGEPVWPVGRVQTPVLAEVVRRDLAIEGFEPTPFWRVLVHFAGEGSPYSGELQAGDQALGDRSEQFADQASATERLQAVEGLSEPWEVREESKERKEKAPPLFSLTSLQKEAAKRFGWTAKDTLAVAQGLYEGGLLTYPRTDATCLPDDYMEIADRLAAALEKRFGQNCPPVPSDVAHAKRIFNSKKVTDHFAIIPTEKMPGVFSSERAEKLWTLVAQRFMLAVHDDAVVQHTTRTLRSGALEAVAKGKVYQEGLTWRVIAREYGLLKEEKAAATLPALSSPSDRALSAELKNGLTKAPATYNEASLLGMMERVASILEDESLADENLKALKSALGERGLGTPATRAEIIEGLVSRELLERLKGKKGAAALRATPRGRLLIQELERRGAKALTLPLRTAEWEQDLKAIEVGEGGRVAFLSALTDELEELVDLIVGDAKDVKRLELRCPKSEQPVLEERSWYLFPGWPDVRCWKTVAKRNMTGEEYADVLKGELAGSSAEKLDGFVSKKGKKFSARLELEGDRFRFKFDSKGR